MNRGFFALILVTVGSIIAGCGHLAAEPTEAKSAKTAPPQKATIETVELLPTIGWEEAPHHIDEEVFLIGQIANTGKSSGGHRFLNFGRERSDLTGFIHRDLVEQFSIYSSRSRRAILGTTGNVLSR